VSWPEGILLEESGIAARDEIMAMADGNDAHDSQASSACGFGVTLTQTWANGPLEV
jgi:hypothetical protein